MRNETLYIGIKEDTKIRKDLLNSSRIIIELLQDMNKSAQLKDAKLNKLKELQKIRDEIKFLNKKTRSKMPSVEKDLNIIKTTKSNKKYTVQQLEKELEEIENKLKHLE